MYTLTTKKSWSATNAELSWEMDKWGVKEWETNYPRGARLEGYSQSEQDRTVTLKYIKDGKPVSLTMGKQARAVDNLRVLYLAINSMRLNEVRGIGEVLEQAYLQLAAPVGKRDPWEVLGISPSSDLDFAEGVYKLKMKKAHPDAGGSNEEAKELLEAIEEVRRQKA